MKAKKCGLKINEQREEIDNFATALFPCAIYDNDLSFGNEIPWHWHDVIELIIVNKGTLQLCCGEEVQLIHTHDGAFINANVLHRAHAYQGESCEFDSLLFHQSLFSTTLDRFAQQSFIEPLIHSSLCCIVLTKHIPWQQEALDCIKKAFDCVEQEAFAHELYLRARCLDLWYLLSNNIHSIKKNEAMNQSINTQRIKSMMSYIHQQYRTNLALCDIAACVSISEREALRCFKKTLGITPIQYLMKYRIICAQRQLEETSSAVTQIASECGFDSPSYFTYLFKRATSFTPVAYRKLKSTT